MTRPDFFVEESQIITALFDEGLELLHVRKPESEPVYSERLLSLIPDNYHKNIVVHDHFYLKGEYGLKGIHLNARNTQLPHNYKGHISCSCLNADELKSEFVRLTMSFCRHSSMRRAKTDLVSNSVCRN